ncbi:MAG: hypothetical protein MJK15_08690 [Colwellia sp.]|nr:hypothetical protein [Colwellia sp.]
MQKIKKIVKKLPLIAQWAKFRAIDRQLHYAQQQLSLAVDSIEALAGNHLSSAPILGADNLIVSLTSYGSRVEHVHLTLLTLLNQSLKPAKVILWLAEDEFTLEQLPNKLLALRQYGLEIAFCLDIRSYKKLIPTLQRYPEHTVVTFDDDILYPYRQLEQLVTSHQQYPNCIICHRAHFIKKDLSGQLLPYQQWFYDSKEDKASDKLMPVGIGGVLYPVGSLSDEVLNQQAFMTLCPQADDLWFKVMAVKNNTLTKLVDRPMPYKNYLHIPDSQINALWHSNKTKNNQQLQAILTAYAEIKL